MRLPRDVLRKLVNLSVCGGSLSVFYEVRGYLSHRVIVFLYLEIAILHLEGKLEVQHVR